MTKTKDELLEKCHSDFLEICFGDHPLHLIKTRVSEKITGYAANTNENIQSIDDFVGLLNKQREKLTGYGLKVQFGGVSKTLLAQDDVAIFEDEIKLIITIEENELEHTARLSSVFEFRDNQWWAVYFYGSLPRDIEGKSGEGRVNEWKEKYENSEKILEKRTEELRLSLGNLKAAKQQLVQQEKLASLGQLTAGIAHEIKNPLNFVNNFSELGIELIEEAREEIGRMTDDSGSGGEKSKVNGEKSIRQPAEGSERSEQGDEAISANEKAPSIILEILNDIEANLKKIHEHGSRADSIVKSMLQHSRDGSGKMEPTNLNALIKEFVNLSFHGMRAGKHPINVDIDLQLDESINDVPLITDDFSRVIVNLCNNAFDAMRTLSAEHSAHKEKEGAGSNVPRSLGTSDSTQQGAGRYEPKLTVRTNSDHGKVTIEIEDNGPGIPDELKDKILQPFFTTKKGTDGTGLGLSITNDIVKAHGGNLKIQSEPNVGSTFVIKIPNDFNPPFSYG